MQNVDEDPLSLNVAVISRWSEYLINLSETEHWQPEMTLVSP